MCSGGERAQIRGLLRREAALGVLVGPPAVREVAIDSDAALREALTRLPLGRAASEVANATGFDRRTLYARALELKGAE